jgi:membrane fusion protein (multidrug efflux system)
MQDLVMERDTTILPPRRRRRLGRKQATVAGALLAAVFGAGWYGYHWWTVGRFIEVTDDAYVGGNVTALAPHVSGFVGEVLVADNQLVHAGQVLIRLDPRDFRVALNHAEAALAAKRATVSSLQAQRTLQEAAISQQQADLAAKSAQATFAAEDAARYRILAQGVAGSRQNAERTASLEAEDRAAVAAADAGLQAARQQLKVLDAQTEAAAAAVAQAESDLETARLNLGYTEIRSPIDGYIGNRAAQVGAYVTPSAYLISVIPSSGLWVDANFKEDQIGGMSHGESASVVADVIPGHVFHGHVASLAPGTGAVFSVIPAENATGNFTKIVQRVPVRIALDAGDPSLTLLRPGLSTTVSVDLRGAERRPQ